MPRDYYQDLEINRDATEADIARAYRKLALRWHPKFCSEDHNTAFHNFCIISEAYEVLSCSIKRSFYDKFGEEKLKEGFFSQGQLKGGYRFARNPEEIFEKFFVDNNPFAQIFDQQGKEVNGSLFGQAYGGLNYPGIAQQQPLIVNVECTLNELYNGCSKEIEFERIVLNDDGRTTKNVLEKKLIEIKPGVDSQAQIVYKKQGNESAGQLPSDLIINIIELKHPQFKRKKNNLIYTAHINLIDALECKPVSIITLDGRKLYVPIDKIISPNFVKIVKGEGMTIHKNDENPIKDFGKPLEKGDLQIKFEIQFPKHIPEDKQKKLKELLQ